MLLGQSALRLGATLPTGIYLGTQQIGDVGPTPTLVPELVAATSGSVTGTSAAIALPAHSDGDSLILLVASNQTPTLDFSGGVASSVPLSSASGRLQAIRVTPAEGATEVTLTSSVSAVLTWWCASWRDVHPTAVIDEASVGYAGNTTAAIETPAVDLSGVASGQEVYVQAASVNASAAWAGAPDTIYSTTSGNAAMSVRSGRVPMGATTVVADSMFNRGLEGTTRIESSLAFVLHPSA